MILMLFVYFFHFFLYTNNTDDTTKAGCRHYAAVPSSCTFPLTSLKEKNEGETNVTSGNQMATIYGQSASKGSKSELIPIDLHVKTYSVTAKTNMFTA